MTRYSLLIIVSLLVSGVGTIIGKDFMNVILPVGSRDRPIIIKATEEEVVFGRQSESGDLQVLSGGRSAWEFVGKNGASITGSQGAFLLDAAEGPDGRLWVLAGYTTASNVERGNTCRLYVQTLDGWMPFGPTIDNLRPTIVRAYDGIRFIGNASPVISRRSEHRELLGLNDGEWRPLPVQEELRKNGVIAWRQSDAWCFWIDDSMSSNRSLYLVQLVAWNKATGIVKLAEWPSEWLIQQAAVDSRGNFAVVATRREDRLERFDYQVFLGYQEDDDRYSGKWIALPFEVGSIFGLEWSYRNILHVGHRHLNTLKVMALRLDHWEEVASLRQPFSKGEIIRPRLSFRRDDTPLVVWEDFFAE